MELTVTQVYGSWGLFYRGRVIEFYSSEYEANKEKAFLIRATEMMNKDKADDGPEVEIIKREKAIRDYESSQEQGRWEV